MKNFWLDSSKFMAFEGLFNYLIPRISKGPLTNDRYRCEKSVVSTSSFETMNGCGSDRLLILPDLQVNTMEVAAPGVRLPKMSGTTVSSLVLQESKAKKPHGFSKTAVGQILEFLFSTVKL